MSEYAISPAVVARDPRFESDPVGYFDSLVTAYGADAAGLVWTAACFAYDELRKGE
jgi:hypothetical protein